MLRCGNGPSIELFEYLPTDSEGSPPPNYAVSGHCLAFNVEDMEQALARLRKHGVSILGDPRPMTEGPSAGLSWVYFLSPWGLQLELVSYPNGMAHAHTGQALWQPRQRQTTYQKESPIWQ